MNGKRFSENKARKNGFYLALAVCLVAVGIAAWSTYDTVRSYLTSTNGTPSSSQVQETDKTSSAPGKTTSGRTRDDDPESPRTAATPAPARQTLGSVTNRNANSRTEADRVSESASSAGNELPEAAEPPEVSSEPPLPVNAPLYEISEELIFPLSSGEIPLAYSAGAPVYSQTMKDWRIHIGMDVKGESGEQVLACGNGQVKRTYTDRMLGNVVEIEHGDYEFYYCGLGENYLVKEGDIVTKGQAIGTVTAVPFEAAEKPHLHLEVRRDSIAIDPQTILKAQ